MSFRAARPFGLARRSTARRATSSSSASSNADVEELIARQCRHTDARIRESRFERLRCCRRRQERRDLPLTMIFRRSELETRWAARPSGGEACHQARAQQLRHLGLLTRRAMHLEGERDRERARLKGTLRSRSRSCGT